MLGVSALAVLATSALSLGPPAETPEHEAPEVAAARLEYELARHPEVYVIASLGERVIRVKARGIELLSIPIRRGTLLSREPSQLPLLVTLAESPVEEERVVIVPPPSDSEATESAAAGDSEAEEVDDPQTTPPGSASPTEQPSLSTFRIRLQEGGVLLVAPDLWTDRLAHRMFRSWQRLRERFGYPSALAPYYIALSLAPEDGERLYLRSRAGTKLLLLP